MAENLREKLLKPLLHSGDVGVFFHSWDVAEIRNPRAGEQGVKVDRGAVARFLPEANGIFESQDDFDRTVEWEPLFDRNLMRHCTDSEAAARATLMNFRRAVESQERAWRFFERTRTRDYTRVVATRADLRFLAELELPEELRVEYHSRSCATKRVWVPRFHSWGGVNDRFSIGGMEAMETYCCRSAFVDGWLLGGGQGNPEAVLMKWLRRSGLGVGFLDFVFQRVRANGEVTEMDRELGEPRRPVEVAEGHGRRAGEGAGQPWEGSSAENVCFPLKERFLILAREPGPMAEALVKVLEPLGRIEVILDRSLKARPGSADEDEYGNDVGIGDLFIYRSDDEARDYGGLMSHSSPFPPVTSWSRAFYHLSETLGSDEAVWFVEDDVAGNASFFERLVRETAGAGPDLAALDIRSRESDGSWPWWGYAEGHFPAPWRSFNPLCRLSARLIGKILGFRDREGGFTFHEVLFASLAKEHDMRCLDWGRSGDFRRLLPCFRYRPVIDGAVAGICHPVKEREIHRTICASEVSPPPREPRREIVGAPRFSRAGFYDGSIQPEEYLWLARTCRRGGVRAVVEIGCGDSTMALLDAGCKVLSLDPDPVWSAHVRRKLDGETGVEFRRTAERRITSALALPFRPDLVVVNVPGLGGRVDLGEACDFGVTIAGRVLLRGMEHPAATGVLRDQKALGRHVRRVPGSSGMAWLHDGRKPDDLADEGRIRSARYRGLKTAGWYCDDFEFCSLWFGSDDPVRALEVGASNGVGANLMLELLFPHPESEVHCIECYDEVPGVPGFREGLREDFEENARRGGYGGRLGLNEGMPAEILAWMIAGEGYWESFDFIHLSGDLGDVPQIVRTGGG